MTSAAVRQGLVDALTLDLVGPKDGLGSSDEVLTEPPARWYLTGFLVPLDGGDNQRVSVGARWVAALLAKGDSRTAWWLGVLMLVRFIPIHYGL
jgi:hypothetical protein